jgi:hypothetical protein
MKNLIQVKNGSIAIIKQDNFIMQINVKEDFNKGSFFERQWGIKMNEENNSNLKEIISNKDLELLRSYIESIKFGSVTLHIHDGKVVQIEKNEKIKIK